MSGWLSCVYPNPGRYASILTGGDWPGTENRAQLPEQLRYPEGFVPDVVEIRSEPAGSTPKGLDTPLASIIEERWAARKQYPACVYVFH
jgi:hypothetical protein